MYTRIITSFGWKKSMFEMLILVFFSIVFLFISRVNAIASCIIYIVYNIYLYISNNI